MRRRVILRPLAQAEYDTAGDWYEHRQAGLGDQFTRAVQRVFDQIASDPLRFAEVETDVREAPVPVFPYCVYYRVRTNRVVVIAVYHSSRDPSGWQSRI